MKLVELNAVARDGEPLIGKIWVNTDRILTIEEYDENKTYILLERGCFYLISEPVETVLNKLQRKK